ncbi:MAG: DUF1566 domain-containing protein [Candidatus Scalindua sp.]|nr:DUF1566 domain-containing protein [Candidatus Scalindua sp.]
MRNFLKCSSFIRMAIIIVVMAFLAGQVTETYATNNDNKQCENGKHKPNKKGNKCKKCKKKIVKKKKAKKKVKKITKIIINNNTSGGGSTGGACDVCDELAAIRDALDSGGNGGDGGGFPCQDGGTPVGDRWVVSDSGVVVCDLDTGYSWQQHPLSIERTWQEALDYCPTLGDGWILPNIDTLETLVDTSNTDPALETGHPFDNVQSSHYWSSTTFVGNATDAWVVNFFNGLVFTSSKDDIDYVWCVRGGP